MNKDIIKIFIGLKAKELFCIVKNAAIYGGSVVTFFVASYFIGIFISKKTTIILMGPAVKLASGFLVILLIVVAIMVVILIVYGLVFWIKYNWETANRIYRAKEKGHDYKNYRGE